jgi:hypothetical protein
MSQWQCAHVVWHTNYDRIEPCKDCKEQQSALFDRVITTIKRDDAEGEYPLNSEKGEAQ